MIKVEQHENKFEISYEGKHAGLMEFRWKDDDTFEITHTEVDADFAGKNLGKELVKSAVEFAKENGKKIIPLCPFAKKVMDRTPEFQEVLA